MKCKVCTRETEGLPQSKYCKLHQKAYDNLNEKFEIWKNASNVEWKSYLAEVAKNPLTGTWAKEVAENLLSEKK